MTDRLRATSVLSAVTLLLSAVALADEHPVRYEMNSRFLTPPKCMKTIGESHGDIATSPAGDIFVSVEAGDHPGIQVYDARGRYVRNVPHAPYDLHGFVIATGLDGALDIFGVSLFGQQIVQLTLDGKLIQVIPATRIPDRYKTSKEGYSPLSLTGIAVAANGDIYAVDGYGRDFIHRFDKEGHYLGTFGGPDQPYGFKTCHKIAIDTRFEPERLLCADREHDRLVQMDLNGRVLGVFAERLRNPNALAVWHDELAVAELGGRVSILDKEGKIIASIGTNENESEIKTNRIPPEQWQSNLFYAPHGIAYDPAGNLLVTEWSQWGRVVRVERRKGG
jgi:hypothetical protein